MSRETEIQEAMLMAQMMDLFPEGVEVGDWESAAKQTNDSMRAAALIECVLQADPTKTHRVVKLLSEQAKERHFPLVTEAVANTARNLMENYDVKSLKELAYAPGDKEGRLAMMRSLIGGCHGHSTVRSLDIMLVNEVKPLIAALSTQVDTSKSYDACSYMPEEGTLFGHMKKLKIEVPAESRYDVNFGTFRAHPKEALQAMIEHRHK